MDYVEIRLQVTPEYTDIITAELAELGCESFVETDEGVNAYLPEPEFKEGELQNLIAKYAEQTAIAYQVSTLQKQNWNEEWERNYQPIEVGVGSNGTGLCRVRASFHEPDERFGYDLVINPKMSFGTGHHETTAMMLEHQLGIDHEGKAVLDVGSGTGILAILAAKRCASAILAFDIEEWAVENARENAALNNCPQVEVFQGTIADVDPERRFGVILANINRNVLLREIPIYTRLLLPNGHLLVSGFYETDAPDIDHKAREAGLDLQNRLTRNQWVSLHFTKPV